MNETDVTVAYEIEPSSIIVQIIQRQTKKIFFSSSSDNYSIATNLVGLPILLSLSTDLKYYDIYEKVWNKVKKYVQKLEYEFSKKEYNNKYPFKLKIVSRDGMRCGKCTSFKCRGCTIPCDSTEINSKLNYITLSVDWPELIFEELFDREIENKIEIDSSCYFSKKENQIISLDDCFKLFLEKEYLGVGDEWYCPKCKSFQKATKQFDIFRIPEILVVHLKRFQYNKFWREKIDCIVEYPIHSLDLRNYLHENSPDLKEDCTYDLFAISSHSGGLGGGHYTAYAFNCELNSWYYFNDSICTKIEYYYHYL
jgi:hypothetical protein